MKKRKTYEISVIDKTYSKTISDETKFYASDTALELGFKLKETEYDFESAEIVLLNIDDRSLVTRPVDKVLDSFAYELEDDIIAHYGEWRGQLRFEQAGEIYVSSPVKFRIENDLSNERPPQLSDVQSWVSLKRYADKLTAELKQAVLSVEGVEDTFNENETERQNQFETAEQSRQTTFESNESERIETFNNNEDIRQAQELEREGAEGKRQTVFDDNEDSRTETFNTNEATRQENEVTRQQAEIQRQSTFETNETTRQTAFENAEQERQSAELIRVENENQRVLTYDNLQDTIDMIGKVQFVNLIDYSNIISNDYDLTINGSEITAKVKNLSLVGNINFTTSEKIAPPNKYYTILQVEVLHKSYSTLVVGGFLTTNITNDLTVGENVTISSISQPVSESSVNQFRFTHRTSTDGYIVGDEIKIKNVIVLNLTSSFGVGNEPTKEVMDWIVTENGYFESLTLSRDDIQQYEINQIRKAVLALGGTI